MPNIQKSCENCEYRVTLINVPGRDTMKYECWFTEEHRQILVQHLNRVCEHWEDDGDYEEIITKGEDDESISHGNEHTG